MNSILLKIFPWIVGLAVLIVGNCLIREILSRLSQKCDLPYNKSTKRASNCLGFFETVAYALAYSTHPEFIAIWLTFKAIDRWSPVKVGSVVDAYKSKYHDHNEESKSEIKRAENNIYLLANLLSILLGVGAAKVIALF